MCDLLIVAFSELMVSAVVVAVAAAAAAAFVLVTAAAALEVQGVVFAYLAAQAAPV